MVHLVDRQVPVVVGAASKQFVENLRGESMQFLWVSYSVRGGRISVYGLLKGMEETHFSLLTGGRSQLIIRFTQVLDVKVVEPIKIVELLNEEQVRGRV